MRSSTIEDLRAITQDLLDPKRPAGSLAAKVGHLANLLLTATSGHTDAGWKDEIRTRNGLAISPDAAAGCINDSIRTVTFLRGLNAAIEHAHSMSSAAVRVLYAGCGPIAPLAFPLMSLLPANKVIFHLVDIHESAIRAVERAIGHFGLEASAAVLDVADAAMMSLDGPPPDVIVLEVMRAALDTEPQVAIIRNLARQAPAALVVPERIDLNLIFLGGTEGTIDVGTAFRLDRRNVEMWSGETGSHLPGSTLRIPSDCPRNALPMLATKVCTFGSHVLDRGVSGLTTHRALTIENGFEPGSTIQFQYHLGEQPRLTARRVADEA